MKTISDKTTRKEAIPFVAYSFQGSGTDGFSFVPYDSSTIISEDETLAVIRCATPYGGNLVEAHLNLQINCVNALGVKVAIGYFDTDVNYCSNCGNKTDGTIRIDRTPTRIKVI